MAHEAVRARVQAVVDERNDLLDLLGHVADGYTGTDGGVATVLLPAPVMDQIRRCADEDRSGA